MATPLAAGCAAVVREFLQTRRQLATPSAALVKALNDDSTDRVAPSSTAPVYGSR